MPDPVERVVLDLDGRILEANEAWRRFARDNRADPATTDVGASYLDTCRRAAAAGSPGAQQMVDALTHLARHPDAPPWHMVYELLGPDVSASFEVTVARVDDGTPRLLVWHRPVEASRPPPATRRLEEALAETEASRQAAVLAMKARTRFLANVSHELRTPLHAILGFARLASSLPAAAAQPGLARMLGNIVDSAERLSGIIDQVLDLSRLLSVPREPPGRTSLAASCERTVEALQPLARARSLDVHLAIEPSLEVAMPAARLAQVIHNLLANAIKFSPPGGTVELVGHGGATVRLWVSDQGPGVPVDEREHIFEEFAQAPRTHAVQGTGLGLTISRELAERYGGQLTVIDRPGWGATFELTLGAADPSPPPAG